MNKKNAKENKAKTKKNKEEKTRRFEDCLKEIDEEIAKKRGKWNLKSLSWLDYDDVSQIIRFHIFKKWHLYDQSKRLRPWVRTIVTNQIKNLIRNNYTNFIKPCAKCAACLEETRCSIYGEQSSACPLYKNWEKNKKGSMYAKMPISLENHSQELFYLKSTTSIDIDRASKLLHEKMEVSLKTNEWKIYKLLYIDMKSEEEAAKSMGYKTSEKNRTPGYKQIKNIKKKIIKKARELIDNDEIDIY